MKDIWLIDDDEDMIHAIQLMLKLLDYKTHFYFTARAALEALQRGQEADLFLLDINMPEVSGIDFLEFLRRSEKWKELPVVMLSTEAADVTVDRALALGADSYVTKPVAVEELQAALEKAFAAHAS